jgi:hypothetical protein
VLARTRPKRRQSRGAAGQPPGELRGQANVSGLHQRLPVAAFRALIAPSFWPIIVGPAGPAGQAALAPTGSPGQATPLSWRALHDRVSCTREPVRVARYAPARGTMGSPCAWSMRFELCFLG